MDEQTLVAVRRRPGHGFLAAMDRIWAAGAAVLPIAPDAREPEVEAVLHAMRPHRFIDDRHDEPLERPRPVPPGTAMVVTTSGTSGTPKGAILSHDALIAAVGASLAALPGGDEDGRWLLCLPTHHTAGVLVALRSRAMGNEPLVHSRFDVDAFAEAEACTHVSLVPTQLARLLDAGVDVARFRAILLGGAAAPPALLARAREAGATVVTSYGMTETCGGCVYDGRPLDGVDVRIGDGERILLRGPVLFDGYHGDPDRTAHVMEGEWLRTSDRGRLEDGILTVLGRADDVIVSGAENVPSSRVAAILEEHPAVASALVVGVPDPEWGHRVCAAVVLRPGHDLTLVEARAHVAARTPRAWAPRQLLVLDEMPRTALGKPWRADVVARAAAADRDAPGRDLRGAHKP